MSIPKANPQKASEDFSFGSKAFNEYHHGRNNSKKKTAKKRLTAKEKREGFKNLDAEMEKYHASRAKTRSARYARILGPSGHAHAVKISKSDLEPFAFQDVDLFREAGWNVVGAPSVSAKSLERNPAPLGSNGLARALIILGNVDAKLLQSLEENGLDCYPAPKAYREGIKKNPAASTSNRVYARLKQATGKGQAWNAIELSEKLGAPLADVEKALAMLHTKGLAHEGGRDLFGTVWIAGSGLERGLFDNPKRGAKAIKKARAWNQKESLVTEPKPIHISNNLEFVEVGPILAIEYSSTKFDGRQRAYRHDVTGKRTMHLSTDGTVIVIKPGFKVTKRGIEG